MKLIIAGSRSIKNYSLVRGVLNQTFNPDEIECVISGKANGADKLGERWADEWLIPIKPFPADWEDLSHPDARIKTNKFGRKYDANAGHRRNLEMAKFGDACFVFWDGKSSGSKDMITLAKVHDLKLWYTDKVNGKLKIISQ